MEKLNVGMVSLGCAKNLVDSEIILGYLKERGHQLVTDPKDADIIIVNTCGFIGPAKEESINAILEMAEYKKTGNCRGLVVTGCLSGRYQDELLKEIPEIDGLLGTNEMDQVLQVIEGILKGEQVSTLSTDYFRYDDPKIKRVLATGSHSAYLKIAEGCSHQCAFCVIPKIRGPYRSRKPHSIISEAASLASQGVKELVVIAQDTTEYGRDLGDESLLGILTELTTISVPWVRVLYTYPNRFNDELIRLIGADNNLVKYVDLPLQHASESMLRRMRRPGNYHEFMELLSRFNRQIPQVTLRSSFIVGFPGETDKDFKKLLTFLQEARFHHVGIFKYSPEEDTPGYEMADQIPEEIKEQRYQEAMALQQKISLARNRELVGKELTVLIDGRAKETDLLITGRHQGQAPDVDGVVYIGNKLAKPGDFVQARIIEAHPYDLVGEIVEGEDE